MSWVRAVAITAAIAVHAAASAAFVTFSANEPDALQSGAGKDDLSIVATVTLQSEESIGLDAVNQEHQDASAAAKPVPQPEVKQEEAKKEDAIEMEPPPPEETAQPQPPIQEKPPEKQAEKPQEQPVSPSVSAAALVEQHAMSKELEARRSQLLSLYNGKIYRALMEHAIRPKRLQQGRVLLELTLAPSGALLSHRVLQSSGSELLDRTAMASLERAAPFPPAPPEVSSGPYTLSIPFEYAVK